MDAEPLWSARLWDEDAGTVFFFHLDNSSFLLNLTQVEYKENQKPKSKTNSRRDLLLEPLINVPAAQGAHIFKPDQWLERNRRREIGVRSAMERSHWGCCHCSPIWICCQCSPSWL